MSPVYSGKGDTGVTESFGDTGISKASPLIEAVGAIDETSAFLGLARSLTALENIKTVIIHIQKQLYVLMSVISGISIESESQIQFTTKELSWIEGQIDHFENAVQLPDGFILPGESPASAAFAVARTVVRRAERRTVSFFQAREIHKPNILAYLNRLSSLIFMLEIYETTMSGQETRMSREG